MSSKVSIGVLCRVPALMAQAEDIARQLNLPLLSNDVDIKHLTTITHLLLLEADGLGIKASGTQAAGVVRVDFVSGAVRHRRLYGGGKSQLIAKAMGLKAGFKPSILDGTAGLGTDSFILASLGCKVTLVERSALAFLLLEDGFRRSRQSSDPSMIEIINRMTLVQHDSIHFMRQLAAPDKPDIVYLDPMFPTRTKSAKVKKEMALFQYLITSHDDENLLLETALKTALKRVVVKRPMHAASLADKEPSYRLTGKSSRFDIYALQKL